MSANNHFYFVGKCYGNPNRTITKESMGTQEHKYYATFTIMTESTFSKSKVNYIPIFANTSIAEKVSVFCRNGNKVAVEGEIMSCEYLDRQCGITRVRTIFMATDVFLLVKAIRTKVANKNFAELVESASIDDYHPPMKKG